MGISGYLNLLSLVDLFIGPSTGPTHLAAALGKPVVAFYSPIKTQSAVRWGPMNICPEHNILVPDVICGEIRKCAGKKCLYHECMSKLEVEDVFRRLNTRFGPIVFKERVLNNSTTLQEIQSSISALRSSKKILTVGDVGIDKYIYGEVSRISPEAPVPVLRVTKKEKSWG